MPVLPTIPNVWRVTLNWSPAHGITPRNVLHFSAPGKTASQIVTALNAAWQTNQWNWVQQDWAFSTVDLLELDGSSATQTLNVTPQGSLVGLDWISGVAGVISFKTAQRGSRGRGRIYLGPLPESQLAAGLCQNLAQRVTDWNAFHASMITSGVVPVVASYVHADAHPITSVRADSVPGLQRRRNDQAR